MNQHPLEQLLFSLQKGTTCKIIYLHTSYKKEPSIRNLPYTRRLFSYEIMDLNNHLEGKSFIRRVISALRKHDVEFETYRTDRKQFLILWDVNPLLYT